MVRKRLNDAVACGLLIGTGLWLDIMTPLGGGKEKWGGRAMNLGQVSTKHDTIYFPLHLALDTHLLTYSLFV